MAIDWIATPVYATYSFSVAWRFYTDQEILTQAGTSSVTTYNDDGSISLEFDFGEEIAISVVFIYAKLFETGTVSAFSGDNQCWIGQ